MEQNIEMFLSLFKVYTNYLEVVKLNINYKKNKNVKRFEKVDDPLECNDDKVFIKKDLGNTKPKSKGIKRKYLQEEVKEENTTKKIKQEEEEEEEKVAVLERGDGVTEDEFYKISGIPKNKKLKKQTRRFWVRTEYKERDKSGYFAVTFKKIKSENPSEFFDLTRMERPIYEMLLDLLRDDLTKTSIRTPIDSECRLAVTLTYLSQSTPLFQLATTFQMGKSTIREIILDTCGVIWKVLSPEYVKKLNTINYKNVAKEFSNNWGLANCIGVFDSRILDIAMPSRKSKEFKDEVIKYMSFSLICDVNYLITWHDIRAYQGIRESSDIFDSDQLDIPKDEILPGSDITFPLYFVGDSSFPFKEHMMRPYAIKNTENDLKKTVFNRYMTTARNIVDNTFGILAARWTILQTEFKCYPQNCEKIISAIIVLHNFIMRNSLSRKDIENRYCPKGFVDYLDEFGNFHLGEWRKEVRKQYQQAKVGSNNATRNAIMMRDILAQYFYLNESNFDV